MRLFILGIVCSTFFLSGCSSQRPREQQPPSRLTREMFLGTWKSEPTGTAKVEMTIIFLRNYTCLITVRVNGKLTNDSDIGKYTLTKNSARIHAKMVNVTVDQSNNYSLDTDEVKRINHGQALELRFLNTAYFDAEGKWIRIDNPPNSGVYRLYRVQTK